MSKFWRGRKDLMTIFVLLLIGVALVMLVSAFKNSHQVRKVLTNHRTTRNFLPRAISMLVLTAQISELVKAVEHVSVVNVVAVLLLMAVWSAGKSGVEDEVR